MATTRAQAQDPTELEEAGGVVYRVIGSAAFKWACAGILAVAGFLIIGGWNSYHTDLASKNPDVVQAKGDIATLKVAVGVLKNQSDAHTSQLSQMGSDQSRAEALQEKILLAVKDIGAGVHALDVKIATVDQKVDDLKDQRK